MIGILFLVLAIIGIAIPLLPTTPFVLLALYCFNKSSKRFYDWTLNIPLIGKGVKEWKSQRIIRRKAKLQAASLLLLSLIFINLQQSILIEIRLGISTILAIVLIFILTRKSN